MSKQQLKTGCYLYILLANQGNHLREREQDTHFAFVSEIISMIHCMAFIYIQISSYNQIKILIKITLTVTGPCANSGHPWAPTLTDALGYFKNE